jgi:GT2 family glycosyltransferase
VVIVTYNSAHCLPQALHSLPAGVEAIVVDNASADGSAEIAERLGARVIRNAGNLGFGRACNRGAALARGEFLLFFNPDAVMTPGALEALVGAARDHPEAAAFQANLVPPTAAAANVERDGVRPVQSLLGAALFVRKAVFDAVGGFDENIFLYFEDTDLSVRLAARGPLLLVLGAPVLHQSGQGAKLSLGQRFTKYRHFAHSRIYFGRKHGQRQDFRLMALEQAAKGVWAAARLRLGYAAQHFGRSFGYLEGYYFKRNGSHARRPGDPPA